MWSRLSLGQRAICKLERLTTRGVGLIAGLLFSLAAHADILMGRVIGVSDGDTVTVLDAARAQHKVRLSGIDASEKAQQFGQRSKESLSRLAYDKELSVE